MSGKTLRWRNAILVQDTKLDLLDNPTTVLLVFNQAEVSRSDKMKAILKLIISGKNLVAMIKHLMATRYTDQKKLEVVKFVIAHDAEFGGGGQAAAKAEFGINPISIKKWCVENGYVGNGKIPESLRPPEPPKQVGPVSMKPGRGKKVVISN